MQHRGILRVLLILESQAHIVVSPDGPQLNIENLFIFFLADNNASILIAIHTLIPSLLTEALQVILQIRHVR